MNRCIGLALAALLISHGVLAETVTLPGVAAPAPHVVRGDAVEKSYRAYTLRLKQLHRLITLALELHAKKLLKDFEPVPPKPVEYGYQILPKVLPDEKQNTGAVRATSASYSWPHTEDLIHWEQPKLSEIEEKISVLNKLQKKERENILRNIILDYRGLESNQRTIDSHVQYNRFWQKAISEDRLRFDHLTKLHDLTVERQAVQDRIANQSTPELLQKEAALAEQIYAGNDYISKAPYLKFINDGKQTTIHIPIYTDIDDKIFLERFRSIVETKWHVPENYSVRLELRPFNVQKAYRQLGHQPIRGEHIDVETHAALFPKDGAVLTTGTNTTHAIPGRLIALGPQEISENVLAHEFGHILGFIDGYFRGYHDLGSNGFEVLEIVPDPDDIMCTPAFGRVRRHHFERLIKTQKSNTERNPKHV